MLSALLVSYAGYPFTPSSLCPDNGLANLAAVLKDGGWDVRILDFGTVQMMQRLYPPELAAEIGPALAELSQSQGSPSPALIGKLSDLNARLEAHQAAQVAAVAREVAAQVADAEPAFVGFKLWNGDGFSGSVTIAEELRRRFPKLPLYAGGPHGSWMGRLIYEHTDAFAGIVVGEGEDKILPLGEAARNGAPVDGIPGVVTSADSDVRATNFVNLDDIPPALYDPETYPAMVGDQKLKLIVLDDSRGCPYGCAFCTHPVESGRRLRTRSAPRIADDMERAITQTGAHSFRFAGSATPGWLMADVAQEILHRGLDVQYTSFAHFASSTPQHFEIMHRSGLLSMFFGLETGCEDLLKRAAGKPIKFADLRSTVLAAQTAGIVVVVSMIVPMPFETEETMAQSLRVLQDIRPDSVPVQFPGLLPGTPWFEHAEEYGFEVDRLQYLRENLSYKIKLLFPPAFWAPLPYRLNGMDFRQFTALTARFAAQLEQSGILTGVPDDNVLMAHRANMGLRQFRDAARVWCATGNVPAVANFVRTFNAAEA
jgi:hypothetical protein